MLLYFGTNLKTMTLVRNLSIGSLATFVTAFAGYQLYNSSAVTESSPKKIPLQFSPKGTGPVVFDAKYVDGTLSPVYVG